MKRLSFIIIALLACFGNSYAEDKLQVEDITIAPGKTAQLNIELSNPDAQYTAIQADLYLPEGIDFVVEDENYKYSLNRVTESHSLSIGKMNGFYRLILSSSKSEVISGTSGKVISLTMKADASLSEGSKEAALKNIKLAKADGSGFITEEKSFIVIISEDASMEESIKISEAKQVPYYSEYNLDFTNLSDLKAYVATGYDKVMGTIWLTRVKQVPAETGFLLMGDPGEYDIPTTEGVSDVYYKNMFKGTLTGTTLYTTDGDYTNYYLSSGASGVGFYKVTNESGQKIGANRCYLPILTEIPAEGSEGDAELIKVSAAKQVPYFTSKNLDFTSLDAQGVKAYTATGYNYGTGVIWLTRVKKVPAQTGILVMADVEGEYNVPTTTVQSVYENMFVGSETAQTIYTNEEIGGVDYVNYYLSKGDAGVGFYKVTNPDGVKMGANRCYLPIPKRDAASGARGKGESSFCNMILSDESNDDVIAIPVFGGMNGEDDGTTGIDIQSSIFNLQSNEVYYNLQGQRVDNPTKGLYIRNGKKVVIK